MMLEATTAGLFASDPFIQPDDQGAIVTQNLWAVMCDHDRATGLCGGAAPVLHVVDRVEKLAPALVHPMHGGSLPATVLPGHAATLRSLPLTFDGRLNGRSRSKTGIASRIDDDAARRPEH